MGQGLQLADPERIGPYRVIGCLGEGGMGRVFLCLSPVGRKLAVKVIREDRAADPVFHERFRREVDAARKVDGLHTAGVVDAQLDGQVLWLATAYGGPSLERVVRECGPLPAGSLLALAAGLAEGLAAIHARGLVHRDLKPSNVLLAEDGPRVIDFGISRAVGDSGLTDAGQVMGTPRFMSPEQVWGKEVGPQSDVFSLGSVLAFAATGHPPFGEDAPENVARRIRRDQPWLDGVPDVIRDLVKRCLARNPGKRPTPDDLVAELGDTHLAEGWLPAPFLTGSPRAAPAPAPATVPGLGSASAPAPGLAPASALGSVPALGSASAPGLGSALGSAPALGPAPGLAPASALGSAPALDSARAWGRSSPDASVGTVRIRRGLPRGLTLLYSEPLFHSEALWRRVRSWVRSPRVQSWLRAPRIIFAGVAVAVIALLATTLTVLAAGHGPGPFRPQLGRTLAYPGSLGLAAVTFSADNGFLAVADGNGTAGVWTVATGRLTGTFRSPGRAGVADVVFGPDGSLLAAAADNGSTYLWDAGTGGLAGTFTDPDSPGVTGAAFSPDGRQLATADDNGSAYLWSVSGRLVSTFTGPGRGRLTGVAFGPHGSLLAAGDEDGSAYLWRTATGRLAGTFTDPGGGVVDGVAFSPDGSLLATADSNGNTYVWTVATGRLTAVLHGPGPGVQVAGVTFSAHGYLLATADSNGNTYVWTVATDRLTATLHDPGRGGSGVAGVAFSPDGSLLATAYINGHVYVWRTGSAGF